MSDTGNDCRKDPVTQARLCAIRVALRVAATMPEECMVFTEEGKFGLVVPPSFKPLRFSHHVGGIYLEDGSFMILDQWLLGSALVTGALSSRFAVQGALAASPKLATSAEIIPFPRRNESNEIK